MDVRDLKYDDNSFDFAIDKSTIDALLCGDSSYINVAIMLKEVQRVLKDGGIYMIISYGKPENRVMHLKRKHLDFEVSIFTIKKESQITVDDIDDSSKIHYVYICKKNKNANEAEKYFEDVYTELLQQELMDKELEYAEMNEEEEEEDKDEIEENNYNEEKQFEKETAPKEVIKSQKQENIKKSSKIVLPKISN